MKKKALKYENCKLIAELNANILFFAFDNALLLCDTIVYYCRCYDDYRSYATYAEKKLG